MQLSVGVLRMWYAGRKAPPCVSAYFVLNAAA